jgi:hypothetical protein
MKKITLSILLLVISFSGFAQSYDEILKQNLTFKIEYKMKLQGNRFKEGGTIKGVDQIQKKIWTLTTEDGKTTAADIFEGS